MGHVNDEMTISISRSALRGLVESAWHDSAAATGERVVAALVARNAIIHATIGDRLPNVGEWSMAFESDPATEIHCDMVLTQDANGAPMRLVALRLHRDDSTVDATAAEMIEAQASLDQHDVTGNADDWEIEQEELPVWAAEQINARSGAKR